MASQSQRIVKQEMKILTEPTMVSENAVPKVARRWSIDCSILFSGNPGACNLIVHLPGYEERCTHLQPPHVSLQRGHV
jgi:hypothetical protein